MSVVDFAILTGLLDELEILKQFFPTFEELHEGADVWYRTRLRSDTQTTYEIVAAFQGKMGPLDANSMTARIIERWDPAHIILVGIAGSFHKDVKLGDVIVSQQVFYFDPGKAVERRTEYRPEGYPCGTVLIRQTEALRLDKSKLKAWQRAAEESAAKKAKKLSRGEKSYRKALQAHIPQIHFGTVASGSVKVAAKWKQKELIALHGKIIGTEMEGAGVLHATFCEELPTPAIVVKGISDKADKEMDLEDPKQCWRAIAKENPVRLVLMLIRRGRIKALDTNQFDLEPTRGSIEEVRRRIQGGSAPGVSYLAFPGLVVPKGPLTGLQIGIEVYGEQGPLDLIRRVVEYRDREGNLVSDSGTEPSVHIDTPILAGPVGIYVQIRGTPARILFSVNIPDSPTCQQKTKWITRQ